MELYPAIDVHGGRVARVPPGLPDDPLELLQAWRAGAPGVRWVHLVDLDRAYRRGDNRTLIRRVLERARREEIQVQVGGGLTSTDEVTEVIGWGAARVVAGTALVARGDVLETLVARHGAERLAVAVEVNGDRLASRGAAAAPEIGLMEYLARVRRQPVRFFVHTDVTRDGTLAGPDLDGARRLASGGGAVIVGGGIGTLDDLARVRAAGLAGAIVGRALHAGRFTLSEALACLDA